MVMNVLAEIPSRLLGSEADTANLTRAPSEYVGMYYGNYTKDANGYYILEDFGTME